MPVYTASQLQTLVLDQLDSSPEFPLPSVLAVINQALYRLGLLTGFNQSTVPIPGFTQANTFQYNTPQGILIPLRLDVEGVAIDKYSLRRLAREFRDWTTDTTAFAGQISRWAMIGFSTFVIHPADAVGGQL